MEKPADEQLDATAKKAQADARLKLIMQDVRLALASHDVTFDETMSVAEYLLTSCFKLIAPLSAMIDYGALCARLGQLVQGRMDEAMKAGGKASIVGPDGKLPPGIH